LPGHRGPLLAYLLVAIACVLVLVSAVRAHPLGGVVGDPTQVLAVPAAGLVLAPDAPVAAPPRPEPVSERAAETTPRRAPAPRAAAPRTVTARPAPAGRQVRHRAHGLAARLAAVSRGAASRLRATVSRHAAESRGAASRLRATASRHAAEARSAYSRRTRTTGRVHHASGARTEAGPGGLCPR
jgi:hypothetical protein